jgi:hypothetical protein
MEDLHINFDHVRGQLAGFLDRQFETNQDFVLCRNQVHAAVELVLHEAVYCGLRDDQVNELLGIVDSANVHVREYNRARITCHLPIFIERLERLRPKSVPVTDAPTDRGKPHFVGNQSEILRKLGYSAKSAAKLRELVSTGAIQIEDRTPPGKTKKLLALWILDRDRLPRKPSV